MEEGSNPGKVRVMAPVSRSGDMGSGAVEWRMDRRIAADIDEYISWFPDDVQKILSKIRSTIKKAAPNAVESITYKIPTYKVDGKVLVYFAAFAKHVSIYPAPRSDDRFGNELKDYKGGKGTVQFPLDSPVPYELISRIVAFRLTRLRD